MYFVLHITTIYCLAIVGPCTWKDNLWAFLRLSLAQERADQMLVLDFFLSWCIFIIVNINSIICQSLDHVPYEVKVKVPFGVIPGSADLGHCPNIFVSYNVLCHESPLCTAWPSYKHVPYEVSWSPNRSSAQLTKNIDSLSAGTDFKFWVKAFVPNGVEISSWTPGQ